MSTIAFSEKVKNSKFAWFGVIGFSLIMLGCIITAIGYQGPSGQRYSMLNYYISELGSVSESNLSIVFNIGIFLGGICFAIGIFGFIYVFETKIGKISCFVGIFSAIFGSLVGVFPMDVNITMHTLTAVMFFYGGMFAIILLTVSLFFEKNNIFPKYLIIVGIVGAIFFIIFNLVISDFVAVFTGTMGENIQPQDGTFSIDSIRPEGYWSMPFFEWLSLLGVLIWLFLASVEYLKYQKRNANNA